MSPGSLTGTFSLRLDSSRSSPTCAHQQDPQPQCGRRRLYRLDSDPPALPFRPHSMPGADLSSKRVGDDLADPSRGRAHRHIVKDPS
jgi:hypothetical protein